VNKLLLELLQEDLPVCARPFEALAAKIGLTEGELIDQVQALKEAGTIRKFGAVIRHQRAGFTSNAMVVFDAPAELVEKAGERISSFAEVSHCYERPKFDGFVYNLYAMMHGKSRKELTETAAKIARAAGLGAYRILWSEKEYKKVSPRYS
jgi:DNA-binding Lrp family transcriptional regulator